VKAIPSELLVSNKALYQGDWLGVAISRNTMLKERKRWGLVPACYWGDEPMFLITDVDAARELRHNTLAVKHGERGAALAFA